MKYALKKTHVIVIFFLVCHFVNLHAKVLPSTAKLLPPETVFLAEINNFQQLKQQFEKTNLYRLYKDPAMVEFVKDFKEKLQKKFDQKDSGIVKAITDGDLLPQGRVAVAFVLKDTTKRIGQPPYLLIGQWGQNVGRIREEIEKTAQKAVEDGAHRKSETYRGVNIVTIIEEQAQADAGSSAPSGADGNMPAKSAQPIPAKTHYCFIDDCLICSADIDSLKFVVAHLQGATSPTLASQSDYNAVLAATGPYHDTTFYVNIKQIIKTIVNSDSSDTMQKNVANLGFENVNSASCSIAVGRYPNNDYAGKGFLKINGAKKGICKMLEPESLIVKAPRFIRPSVCSVMFFHLDIKKVYTELAGILSGFSPQVAAIMYMPIVPPGPSGEPGLQLKPDIIDHLGSEIVVTQSVNKPFSASSAPIEYLFSLAVNNRPALEKSLNTLHSRMIAPNNPDSRRELLGHTIYSIQLGNLPFFGMQPRPMQEVGASSAPQMPKLAFTITNTHLIFATESAVEQAIRKISSSESPSGLFTNWFTKAKSGIPAAGMASFENVSASSEVLWWMMKQKGNSGVPRTAVSANPSLIYSQMGFGLFDFKLLPDFETVRKYFGLSTSYMVSRDDGFFLEFKDIYPKKTN